MQRNIRTYGGWWVAGLGVLCGSVYLIVRLGGGPAERREEIPRIVASGDAQVSPYPSLWNKDPLLPNALAPLPLGSITPSGWLGAQLRVQAEGLSGHLEEFWPDLGPESGWLGGKGESWERAPYYLDGLIPLAYQLHDQRLIGKIAKWINWTLEHQQPNGEFGPVPTEGMEVHQAIKLIDWWPRMVMLKVLRQYFEVSQDPRIPEFMARYFEFHRQFSDRLPLFNWAAFRWGEELLSVLWLYNRDPKPELLSLANILHSQGFDWRNHFERFSSTGKLEKEAISLASHGVNNAMAMKTETLWGTVSRDVGDLNLIYGMLDKLDTYHGQPNGMHAADEHYAGLEPTQGAELCAVVESMFSYEVLLSVLGDPRFGDRLEKLAFNALPGTMSEDMWSHQYDQQVNQAQCSLDGDREWVSNGPDSNLYGLEPFYGCCTANMHQGWPKFVSHLWMATRDGGLAAVAYGPNEVEAQVRGGTMRLKEDTEYPFREAVKVTVEEAPGQVVSLQFRIPAWASGARLTVNGEVQPVKVGNFVSVSRVWRPGDLVDLSFPMEIRLEKQLRNARSVHRGPLTFSLRVGERWQHLAGEPPHDDWQVFPTSAWNYGLSLDSRGDLVGASVAESPVTDHPFSHSSYPVQLKVQGRKIPYWKLVHGSAGPVPTSPVADVTGSSQESLLLVPYGATALRMTTMPWIEER
jgi:hypothetical protein